MNIRPAGPADAPAIQALYEDLVPGARGLHVDPRRVLELQDDPTNHLLVIELEGKIAGTAFLTICLDPMFGFQSYAVVENLIVDQAMRGRGLGRCLMDAVESLARAARCTRLMLLSSAHRAEAHKFFLRVGYDGEKKRAFVKYLNRPPSGPASGAP